MDLSAREFEIVEQIALGATKKEVARKVCRSTYTIETTIKNAYQKLGINKLSDLVLWYCGYMFNIADDIANLKKQVLPLILMFIIGFNGYANQEYSLRRYRRHREIEVFIPLHSAGQS